MAEFVEKVDSPVLVNKTDVPGGGSSDGSGEESFVAVEKAPSPAADDDDEDEDEFMQRSPPRPKEAPPPEAVDRASSSGAPKPSARLSVGPGGAPPSQLQVTTFGATVAAAAPSVPTIDVKDGYRARLLAGARSARDRVRETSATDVKFNCVVVILVGSLTQMFASIPFVGMLSGNETATVYTDPELPPDPPGHPGQVVTSAAIGEYALSVGIISTVACLGYLLVCVLSPARLSQPSRVVLHGKLTLSLQTVAALFFGAWWAAGAGVGTFIGPHKAPGNGYFGCFLAFAASLRLLNVTFDDAPRLYLAARTGPNGNASAASKRYLLLLMGWGLVLLLASLHVAFDELSNESHYVRGQSIWALLVSCLALKDGAMLLMMQSADVTRKYVAAWQLILWLSAAIVLTMTYRAPFRVASNGWFATWLGAASAVALALEEFQKAVTATTPLKAVAAYTGAGLVLLADSSQYLGRDDPFVCANRYTGVTHACAAGLANFAFAYGLLSSFFGLCLALLMYVHAGTPPSSPLLAPLVGRVRGALQFPAAIVIDGPMRVVSGAKITPLKVLGGFLLAFAVSAALALTYFFPPYADIDNGFVACWLSVGASALLLQEPPQVAEISTEPRSLAVITTISGDAAAAELGVSDFDDPSRRSVALGARDDASERPSNKLLTPTTAGEYRPPYVAALAIASVLVIVAAAERLGGVIEGVSAGVSEEQFHGEAVWALVCSGLTLAILAVRYIVVDMKAAPLDDNREYVVRVSTSALLCTMWTVSAILFTFVGPFVDIGNGYVATAASLGGSVAMLLDDFTVQSLLLASRPLEAE